MDGNTNTHSVYKTSGKNNEKIPKKTLFSSDISRPGDRKRKIKHLALSHFGNCYFASLCKKIMKICQM